MPIQDLDIFCHYDQQRFIQFGAMDCSNWYLVQSQTGKKGSALYPAMGRRHINTFGQNRLVFNSEPRFIFKTINYAYAVVGTQFIKIDRYFNEQVLGTVPLGGEMWFDWLPVGTTFYGMLTTRAGIYVIEENGVTVTMQLVTDPNAPTNPGYIKAFGNRFIVSQRNTPDFHLTQISLGGVFNPATVFTIPDPVSGGFPLFARASGIIRQIAVLKNQLYLFSDFKTDIWANIPTRIEIAGDVREFPFKLNTSYNFDVGIADPYSLSVGFGMMAFLGKNEDGLVSFMVSNGQQPQDISSQAINVLLENSATPDENAPNVFNSEPVDGFLYQYENSIFYRVSCGNFENYSELDINNKSFSFEYNFAAGTWHRVTELNGERNRIKKHVFFQNNHLVTVMGDPAIYQMAGNFYRNELRNTNVSAQAPDAFIKYPMRYSFVTQQIYMQDYAEFATDYIEIDFVFGDRTFYESEAPFDNTVFVVTEDSDPNCPTFVVTEDKIGEPILIVAENSVPEDPVYMITEDSTPDDPIFIADEEVINGHEAFIICEDGNTPTFVDNHYYNLFKPHIALYYSDDGGITYHFAQSMRFSPLGHYRWRMRWYQLGVSRNRCYRLLCVSSAPIVPLGAVQNIRRTSGGAN